MTEEEQKIREAAKTLFPTPYIAEAIVDLVVTPRPRGWGRKSNAPYFTEKYGKWIKKDIDDMIGSGGTILFRWATFCDKGGVTRKTLYNMVNQAIRYVLERMDTPERKYQKWHELIKVREEPLGIEISWIPGANQTLSEGPFVSSNIQSTATMPDWKIRLEEWLEGSKKEPFIQEGLLLNPDEILIIKADLSHVKGVLASVKSDSIKIIKANV